jgi:serine/threonine-protein kinase
MALTSVLIYILLVLGIALVALGVFVVARQLLRWDTNRAASAGVPGPYLSVLVIVVGIASLGASGFLSLKKPASPATAQPQPSVPAASTQTTTTAPAATSSATGSAVATGSVTLTAPSPGTKVQGCGMFTGTSSLPPGKTVVVGVRNLSDAGHTIYLEPVNKWEKPSALTHWTGFQYFGSGDSSVGQTYVVSIIVMPSSTVKSALAIPANHVTWAVISLPAGARVRQTLHLTRASGQGPAACR